MVGDRLHRYFSSGALTYIESVQLEEASLDSEHSKKDVACIIGCMKEGLAADERQPNRRNNPYFCAHNYPTDVGVIIISAGGNQQRKTKEPGVRNYKAPKEPSYTSAQPIPAGL